VLWEPTRPVCGEGRCRSKFRATVLLRSHRGKGDGMFAYGDRRQRGRPPVVAGVSQPDAREGQAGPRGESERFIVPSKPGNAGGGKGPQFQGNVRRKNSREIGDEPNTSTQGWETPGDVTG